MRIETGTQIGGYTILSRLGRGGMATVYLAREADLDRMVALKVLPEQLVDDQDFGKRFEQEARVIASLDHPNIIPLYRYGIAEDVPWMALRYVDGGDFESALKSGNLDIGTGMTILRGVAAALDYAHRRGIVHRDLKPQNILLTEDRAPYLADFGVAKLLEGAEKLKTATGNIFGTPAYMAPEQAKGEALGPYTDIYALAVIACRILTGYLPFDADTPHAILLKHITAPLPPPVTSTLPAPVATALALGLAKDPAARPASAGAFIEGLDRALAGQAPSPVPVPVPTPVAATQVTPLPSVPASSLAATQMTPLPQVALTPPEAAAPSPGAMPAPASQSKVTARRGKGWMIGVGVAAAALIIAAGVGLYRGWGSGEGFFAFSAASSASTDVASGAASSVAATAASAGSGDHDASSAASEAEVAASDAAASTPAESDGADGDTGTTAADDETAGNDVQPSFDCRRATTQAERLICTSPELAQADRTLQEVYGHALEAVSDKQYLKSNEIDWIREVRDACTDEPCLTAAYQHRIQALSDLLSQEK